MTTTEKPAWATKSIVVTIRQEVDKFVARDANGTWKTRANVSNCDLSKPLASQMFHADEVKSESVNEDGSVTAEIWEA